MNVLFSGLLLIGTIVFYLVAFGAYIRWRLLERGTSPRYAAKGMAWLLNILAPFCLVAIQAVRLSTPFLGLETDVSNLVYTLALLGVTTFVLASLARDKDDDPFRDLPGSFKNGAAEVLSWRPSRTH